MRGARSLAPPFARRLLGAPAGGLTRIGRRPNALPRHARNGPTEDPGAPRKAQPPPQHAPQRQKARPSPTPARFPTYCITEDYALGMELKAAGFVGRYLAEYLAVRLTTFWGFE